MLILKSTRKNQTKMIENLDKVINTTDEKFDFSVFIPTWNNLEYLKLCVSSIQKNSTTNIQLIVLVNEGADGTLDWLKTQKDLDYIHAKKNIGICYGLNVCRSLVKSDYVAYLNDDMYALPNWDKILKDEIAKLNTKLFMISSTMIEPHNTKNPCVKVQNYGDSLENFNEELLLKEYKNLSIKDWSGSTWPPNVVHIDTWDLVGGLSVEFSPGMYSDPDFSKKLYEAGVRTFKGVGNSLVYHFGSKSTKRVKKNTGRDMFLLKWGMAASFFSKNILKMGKPYHKLPENRKITYLEKSFQKLKSLKTLLDR